MHVILACIVGQPNFFGISASMSTVDVWPNRGWTPIFSQFGSRLTTSRRLRKSEGRSELALPGDLRSLRDMVKRLPNWLKIGVQAGVGPNFTVELEADILLKICHALIKQSSQNISLAFFVNNRRGEFSVLSSDALCLSIVLISPF